MSLHEKTATELAGLLRARQVSAVEVAEAFLARIRATEPQTGAFLALEEAPVLAAARAADEALASGGGAGPLTGIPVGLKDNICTGGTPTTCASRMLAHFVPPCDAAVVSRLKAAGAVLCGKLNMDEFAMGSTGESSYFKSTRNPWNAAHLPGGSSSGSAAAVAACQLPLALGSDTGGSIRLPAAWCGLVGLKPTWGAVSRRGLVAFASSFDQIGPLARTVQDCALLYAAICGRDEGDATSREAVFDAACLDAPDVKGLTIGVPGECFGPGVDAEVKQAVERALERYEQLGANVAEVSLPATEHALAAYAVLASAQASSNLARYDGVRYGHSAGGEGGLEALYLSSRSAGFGPEVRRRILLGTWVLAGGGGRDAYRRAQQVQRQLAREFGAAFERCHLIATPAAPRAAFKRGKMAGDPAGMDAVNACLVPANLAGLPALSLPIGLNAAGLPMGLQLVGPAFAEGRLLAAARAYEDAVGGFPLPNGGREEGGI